MIKKYIITGMIALTVMAAAAGMATIARASDDNSSLPIFGHLFGRHGDGPAVQLTDTQKTEMQAKMEAVKNALKSGDYNSWTTAVKAMDANSPLLSKVTADNFSEYAANEAEREAAMAERKTKQTAVEAAITANDYEAWTKAVKALNENSQALQKITSENFEKYVEANKLRNQSDSILKELGVNGFETAGFGGRGHGGMGGHGGPFGMGDPDRQAAGSMDAAD